MPRCIRRRLLFYSVALLAVWRLWPVVPPFVGTHLSDAAVNLPLPDQYVPPARVPDEIRSGMAHAGFDFPTFATQVVFCPRAMRHGHAFWCNDPALPDEVALELAGILANPATYQPWWGAKGCGGFHGDWYLRWGEGKERKEVILCEGCREALVYFGGGVIRFDLSEDAYTRITSVIQKEPSPHPLPR